MNRVCYSYSHLPVVALGWGIYRVNDSTRSLLSLYLYHSTLLLRNCHAAAFAYGYPTDEFTRNEWTPSSKQMAIASTIRNEMNSYLQSISCIQQTHKTTRGKEIGLLCNCAAGLWFRLNTPVQPSPRRSKTPHKAESMHHPMASFYTSIWEYSLYHFFSIQMESLPEWLVSFSWRITATSFPSRIYG